MNATTVVPLCSINRHNAVWSGTAASSKVTSCVVSCQVGEYIYLKTNQNKVLSDSEFVTETGRSVFLDSVVNEKREKHEHPVGNYAKL
jgi:hypothetical protein